MWPARLAQHRSTLSAEREPDDVKLLDILERSVERVIQGPVDALFRQEIQPAEIERHLERAMLDSRRRASGASIMPNKYVVQLYEADYAAIEPYKSSLVRRLESWLADTAAKHNGTLLDRIQVEIEVGQHARRRRPVVNASITDIQSGFSDRSRPHRKPEPANRTEAFSVVRSHNACTIRVLTGQQKGQSFPIPEGSSTLGRSTEADIRIDAPEVSRNHLRIERHGSTVRITDLESTNGTRVNGEPIGQAALRHGDEILVGTQSLRYVES